MDDKQDHCWEIRNVRYRMDLWKGGWVKKNQEEADTWRERARVQNPFQLHKMKINIDIPHLLLRGREFYLPWVDGGAGKQLAPAAPSETEFLLLLLQKVEQEQVDTAELILMSN